MGMGGARGPVNARAYGPHTPMASLVPAKIRPVPKALAYGGDPHTAPTHCPYIARTWRGDARTGDASPTLKMRVRLPDPRLIHKGRTRVRVNVPQKSDARHLFGFVHRDARTSPTTMHRGGQYDRTRRRSASFSASPIGRSRSVVEKHRTTSRNIHRRDGEQVGREGPGKRR